VTAASYRRDRVPAKARAAADASTGGQARHLLAGAGAEAVHISFAVATLSERGAVEPHRHSCEESFFVLEGRPRLHLGGREHELEPGDGGLIGLGIPHAWESPAGGARWVEVHSPRAPQSAGVGSDTFAVATDPGGSAIPLDQAAGDAAALFHFRDADMDPDRPAGGSAGPETGLLTFGGIRIRMLVDERRGATLQTMFVAEASPGGAIGPHDHPFEEAYLVLEGEVEAEAEDERFRLAPGDFLWTAVGCVHAFANRSAAPVRWLEVQSPQPPSRHAFRFAGDWPTAADAAVQ
jgi:quercetin dioxygenase-like cupin family protein